MKVNYKLTLIKVSCDLKKLTLKVNFKLTLKIVDLKLTLKVNFKSTLLKVNFGT